MLCNSHMYENFNRHLAVCLLKYWQQQLTIALFYKENNIYCTQFSSLKNADKHETKQHYDLRNWISWNKVRFDYDIISSDGDIILSLWIWLGSGDLLSVPDPDFALKLNGHVCNIWKYSHVITDRFVFYGVSDIHNSRLAAS